MEWPQPLFAQKGDWKLVESWYIHSDKEYKEPCEGRFLRTVLWEGRGGSSRADPIG